MIIDLQIDQSNNYLIKIFFEYFPLSFYDRLNLTIVQENESYH